MRMKRSCLAVNVLFSLFLAVRGVLILMDVLQPDWAMTGAALIMVAFAHLIITTEGLR